MLYQVGSTLSNALLRAHVAKSSCKQCTVLVATAVQPVRH